MKGGEYFMGHIGIGISIIDLLAQDELYRRLRGLAGERQGAGDRVSEEDVVGGDVGSDVVGREGG